MNLTSNISGEEIVLIVDTGEKGDKGDTGAQGIQGVPGQDGTDGDQGIQGEKGDRGLQGIQGPIGQTGPAGSKGDKGDQGIQGVQGIAGIKGDTGNAGANGAKGDTGLKGDAGAAGAKGDTGLTGAAGATGAKGDKGDQGLQGVQGVVGPIGVTGLTGPKGDQGIQGVTGAAGQNGAAGAKGDKGNTGDQGIQGLKGDTGATGPTGTPGIKGDTGNTGTKGDKGDQGVTGPIGPTGLTGATGAKGDSGIQGVQGVVGPKGTTGDIGPKGDQGIQGVTGTKGDTGNVGATGSKGDTGLKGDTGTAGAKGDTGLTGLTGATGLTGSKGDKGDTGLQGVAGTAGASGATGPAGSKGDKGDQGSQGVTGNTGATGPQGATGLTGAKGDTGIQGPIGVQGIQGVQGATGLKGDQGIQGVAGPLGLTGPAGSKGDKGDKGNQGVAGPIGPQGVQGETGQRGPIGETNTKTFKVLGNWNASTNVPALSSSTSLTDGSGYVVKVAGTQAITGGSQAFNIGDLIISDGSGFYWVPLSADSNDRLGIVETKITDLNSSLNGARVDNSGNLTGAILAPVQYQHVRGNAEMAGNGEYENYGYGNFELMTRSVVSSKIQINAWIAGSFDVICRVCKGSSIPGFNSFVTPGDLTNIVTVTIPNAEFNKTANGSMILDLGTYIRAVAGEVIFVFLSSNVPGGVKFNKWNAQSGSSPFRHSFIVKDNAGDPWATSWYVSDDPYYAASFKLLYSDLAVDLATKRVAALENGSFPARITAVENRVDANGRLVNGQYIKSVVWQHPRPNEMFAPVLGGFKGKGWSQQMTERTTLNKGVFPAYSLGDADIDVRVYKSLNYNAWGLPSSTGSSLLHSQTISAANFNKNPDKFQTILFDTDITIEPTYYIYIVLYCATTISYRFWNSQASSPSRPVFIYYLGSTPWAPSSGWEVSSSPDYCDAPFQLSYVDYPTAKELLDAEFRVAELEKKVNATPVPETRNPTVPKRLIALIGTEKRIQYNAVAKGVPHDCSMQITSDIGATFPRNKQILATSGQAGTRNLVFSIYRLNKTLIESKTVQLTVINRTAPTTQKYYMLLGDSLTDNISFPAYVKAVMSSLSGANKPISVGSKNVEGDLLAKHEGYSGYEVGRFTQPGSILWNPAANDGAGGVDVTYYRAQRGLSALIDVVNIWLGPNTAQSSGSLISREYMIANMIDKYKILIDRFLFDNPACKIIIQLPTMDKDEQWLGEPGGIKKEIYQANLWLIKELILEFFDTNTYHANVSVGDVGLCVDRKFGYPQNASSVGETYAETEPTLGDFIHLRPEGYDQAARDTAANMLYFLQQ